ncbi:alpha/beta-hydrolase, partial [Mycena capillaripes]
MVSTAIIVSAFVIGCSAANLQNAVLPVGRPPTGYGPAWQKDFEVTKPLPNITHPLTRSFAGNIEVNRDNGTLFFWGFEKTHGSLTAAKSTDPWMIWLNGGPGSSSLIGLFTENGPIHVTGTYSIVENKYAWNKLADTIWIEQPVGVGYSTVANNHSYVADEDQMGEDFVGFLSNLVKVFPSLATRPLYLTGESYAGTYIPYITKTIFSIPHPPVNLKKIAIGDGAIGSKAVFEEVSTLTTIETYPELIDYDPEVYNYFKEQEHLCGYDLKLTYPQGEVFPTLLDPINTITWSASVKSGANFDPKRFTLSKKAITALKARASGMPMVVEKREIATTREALKRSLVGRPNGTLDPFYGCFIWEEMLDYAFNFTFPWTLGDIDVYDVPDALNPQVPTDPAVFMNDPRTRAALHAPAQEWLQAIDYPFQANSQRLRPMVFLSELAANASKRGVGIVFYSGNDDTIAAHRGTEVVIQNMTFGGIQGFTRKPATPFTDDEGNFAGVVHQERGVTYALFKGAGHFVPRSVPVAAFTFVREFILGSNKTGFVDPKTGKVVGGEYPSLAQDVMPGGTVIYYGDGSAGKTTASTSWPSATIEAWNSFIATATATVTGT